MTIPAEQPAAQPAPVATPPDASPAGTTFTTPTSAPPEQPPTAEPEAVYIEVGADELSTLIDVKEALLERSQADVAEAKAALDKAERASQVHFEGVTALKKTQAALAQGSTVTLAYYTP